MASNYKLVRLIRTPTSECYLIWDQAARVGQADIHYTEGLVHCTIIIEEELTNEQINELVAQLADDSSPATCQTSSARTSSSTSLSARK